MSREGAYAAFLTTEEVLGCLKVNPRTIYRLIKTGELPAVRIGRQWRFRAPIWTSGLIGSERQHRKRQAKGKSPHRREHAGGYLNRKPAHVCQGRTVIKWSGWS